MSPMPVTPARVLELAQAGANEAALSVARLLKISVAQVGLVETMAADVLALRHGPRALVVGFTVSGALQGRFAMVTSEMHAKAMALQLVSFTGDSLSTKAIGALTELGNIGASAYLSSIADLLCASCMPSVPSWTIDEASSAVAASLGRSLIVAPLMAGPHRIDLALSLP